MKFFERIKGTHRDHQVVFGLQLVTQREDEALGMLLALTNEEHPTHKHTQAHTETIQMSFSEHTFCRRGS